MTEQKQQESVETVFADYDSGKITVMEAMDRVDQYITDKQNQLLDELDHDLQKRLLSLRGSDDFINLNVAMAHAKEAIAALRGKSNE
jgi:hypothetical protein